MKINYLNNAYVYLDIDIREITQKTVLINKEIQKGAVGKSYMTNGTLTLSHMTKYLRISSYIRKALLIYDFATAPI
jgi:hypothetical protein